MKTKTYTLESQIIELKRRNLDYLAKQQQAEHERDAAQEMANSIISDYDKRVADLLRQRDELLEALKGVLRIADRKTVEFDAAHDAISKAEEPAAAQTALAAYEEAKQ